MDDSLILEVHWPDDLDPETVPFATRTQTVLRWRGLYDDPARFNTLTVAEVAGCGNTGPVTIANLRTTAHTAIRRHHQDAPLRERMANVLADVATAGTKPDQRALAGHLNGLRTAIDKQAALSHSTTQCSDTLRRSQVSPGTVSRCS